VSDAVKPLFLQDRRASSLEKGKDGTPRKAGEERKLKVGRMPKKEQRKNGGGETKEANKKAFLRKSKKPGKILVELGGKKESNAVSNPNEIVREKTMLTAALKEKRNGNYCKKKVDESGRDSTKSTEKRGADVHVMKGRDGAGGGGG